LTISHDHTTEFNYRPTFEAVAAHSEMGAYYRFKPTPDITLFMSDQQCGQLMDALASRPPLPLCPDSPDGNHHAAPKGSEEDLTLECKECYYCGEKATQLPNRRDNSESREVPSEVLRSEDAPF
jgi:hypothetical protein